MKYIPIPESVRLKKLKADYAKLPVPMENDPYVDKKFKQFATGDRWITLGYLRGWKKYIYASTTRLRASYAEAEELYQAKPVILDNDLLLGHLYLPEYSKEELMEYEYLADAFDMSSYTRLERPPRKDHIALDYEKLIKVGLNGLKKEIRSAMQKVNLADGDMYGDFREARKHEFYQCLMIELNAVSDLARRYSEKAREMAEYAEEPRKSELLKMAEVISRVPDEPAQSFYEAVQSVHFFLSTLFGLYPLGRPDKYLYELYRRDIESCAITREFAQELIDNFCLGISDRVFTRAACGFIVGGSDENGNAVENELTYMFITALDHLRLPDPNGALAVADKTSDELIEYCAEVLYRGTTHPAFYNDSLIVRSMIENYAVAPCDAPNYIHATCAEMSIAGKSKSHSTPFISEMPKLLYDTVKKASDEIDFDTLLSLYLKEMHDELVIMSRNYLIRMLEGARIGYDSTRTAALVDDCIKRGLSLFEGGERYTMIQPIFIGFANAVDSLIAIKHLVFEEKKLALSEFSEIVSNNFDGNEELRHYILDKLPHYGNDEAECDLLAKRLAKEINDMLHTADMPLGKYMVPGTFSYINHAKFGEKFGATFDGRLSGEAFADGCCPAQGMDKNGPTALINSLTSWDQSKFLGGMVVNLKLGKSNLEGEKKKLLPALIRSFIKRGGIEIQVNVVDKKTLLDARENPKNHENLLVRIGGFSDYFVRLTPALQEEIIKRTEY